MANPVDFSHYEKKANFQKDYDSGKIKNETIVFIKETREIWTHDAGYKTLSDEQLQKLESIFKIDFSNFVTEDDVKEIVKETLNDADSIFATKAHVEQRLQDIINNAPENLDTLGEIAEALKDNDDAVAAIVKTLAGKASSEDVTNAIKESKEYSDSKLTEAKSYTDTKIAEVKTLIPKAATNADIDAMFK